MKLLLFQHIDFQVAVFINFQQKQAQNRAEILDLATVPMTTP